ncbi:MAG: DUF3291 domain-containing protein, partial [Phototrophicaceae bacterium]
IAQVNIGRLLAPIDHPTIKDFVDNLDRINALAEATPGFVWRLMTPAGNATALQVFPDPQAIINMSVWESIEALHQYAYYSDHAAIFRRRREWFEKMETNYMALWYVPAGEIPTPDDAKARLAYMDSHGITPYAFTFKQPFSVDDLLAYTASRAAKAVTSEGSKNRDEG